MVVKAGVIVGLMILALNLLIAGYAALLPVHLLQESDVLNYHLSLPRQHLILESFRHISWSSADLWPLPVDFALAPYWLATEWPNKIPQFICLLGLLAVIAKLSSRLGPQSVSQALFVLFALIGSHFVGIQMGTAMLDLALCYLFFAALDSFLNGKYGWAALEFTFLFWSKPMMPLLWLALAVTMGMILWISVRRLGLKLRWGFEDGYPCLNPDFKKKAGGFIAGFLLLSVAIGGPFVVKSIYTAGTPIFPVGAGWITFNPQLQSATPFRQGLLQSAQEHMATKDNYGFGRSLGVVPKSLWLMAVPESGVNNSFDYPVGLPYLL
ncbi:MAG: hypothetical protein Q7T18_05240, partial [Sedimentisphaerales bacterium]|nr:hypothetical protein [Sedimentisphaerales bacterium]